MSVTAPSAPPIPAGGYVPVSQFGGVLIAALEPWMTLHLAWVCDAIGVMCDPLYTLVTDHGNDGDATYLPGYGQLFNINPQAGQPGYGAPTCPTSDLPYVAQFVGVQIPVGSSDQTARSLVLTEAGLSRGTPAAVIAAAARCLTGTQSVQYIERTYVDGSPNAGWFGLSVRPEELPSAATLINAVNAVKLGGLQWWLAVSDGTTWNAETSTFQADIKTWRQKG